MSSTVTLVVPIQDVTVSNSRLQVTGPLRAASSSALLLDTVRAARGASRGGDVLIVADSPQHTAVCGARVRGLVHAVSKGEGMAYGDFPTYSLYPKAV